MSKEFSPPRIEVIEKITVERNVMEHSIGEIFVSRIVAVVPAPELGLNYLAHAASNNNVGIFKLVRYPDDFAEIYEIFGKDMPSNPILERIEKAQQDMEALVNAWHDPELALNVLYSTDQPSVRFIG